MWKDMHTASVRIREKGFNPNKPTKAQRLKETRVGRAGQEVWSPAREEPLTEA